MNGTRSTTVVALLAGILVALVIGLAVVVALAVEDGCP